MSTPESSPHPTNHDTQHSRCSSAALLSVTSHYSLLHGVLSPQAICTRARELGYSAVALTDRDNLYGLPVFLQSCKEQGLRAIIASELSVCDDTILLYAHGDRGYGNLCRLISEKHCDRNFNLTNSLKSDSTGIYGVTDSISLLSALDGVLPLYYRMTRPRKLPLWIREHQIQPLVIPHAAFTCKSQFDIHHLLRAIDCNTTLSRLNNEELLKPDALINPWDAVRDRFEVFEDAIKETVKFSEKIVSRGDFGKFLMPSFASENSSKEMLRQKAFEGAKRRYGGLSDAVVKRLDYELNLIESKNFSGYFLVVDDIVKQSPRTCGRGSGAASIVAYSLGITNVDPIRYDLMFERFLNPGRTDPPDIDVDFAWDERDDVLHYVFQKYGKEHTAMVATHQTCGIRMAVREVARVYGCTEQEISDVTKRMPWFAEISEQEGELEAAFGLWPQTKHLKLDPPWPAILSTAQKIIGMPRGIGTHCGGVIITPVPINRAAPIQYSAKGFPILQWEKDGAEAMGLVKIDLLGNRSLAVIRDAVANVKSNGYSIDESTWDPQGDRATVDLLARGQSMGVFYVESPAMRLLQKKSGKGDFEHLVIHSSIIRPAANSYIKSYIERLHGKPYKALHPLLAEVLKETFGIMVYQEDVSKVAMALAGFSFEEADILRKIMSKKTKSKKFEDYKKRFFDEAVKRGVEQRVIGQIWNMMLSFSGYSFCKPHSASYVQVSFQSAYLKAHYPAEFMAAVLSNYGGYYSTQAYISEAMRLGVEVVPPDVNMSDVKYYSGKNRIYTGLCQIKGLTGNAQKRIVSERLAGNDYRNMEDFHRRTELGEADLECLILAGAFDNVCKKLNRSQQFWQMRSLYRCKNGSTTPSLKPISDTQYLAYQYKMLGFLTPNHPIAYVKCSERNRLIKIADVDKCLGKLISFLGWCITSKTVSTKTGQNMDFVTFEDETGTCETVLFPQVYQKYAWLLGHQSAVVISGRVTEEFGVKTVEIRSVRKP